uniref:hypothetical protein n=1 Tax=Klebsiella sp. NA21 TaxID=3374532 RepID=UPI003D335C5D
LTSHVSIKQTAIGPFVLSLAIRDESIRKGKRLCEGSDNFMGDSKYICRGCSLEYDTLSDIFISNNSDNGPTIFRQQLLIVLHPLETVDTIFL